MLTISALLAVERYFEYQAKGLDVFYKKIKWYFQKNNFETFRLNFKQKQNSFFVMDGKMMVGIAGEST